jgi:hypothetical protein
MPSVVSKGECGVHIGDVELGQPRLESPSIQVEARPEEMSVLMSVHHTCDASKLAAPRRKRTGSCPPKAGRSSVSRSWSMEWLRNQVHVDADIVSSSRKKGKQVVLSKEGQPLDAVTDSRRKKVGGMLCRTVHSLKKVVRLPSKDRSAMLHDLKRRVRKR